MAVHKVPLDVEADDKFLGPLSFKQFLFGGGTLLFGYATFLLFSKGIWPIGFIFTFPTIVALVLTIPWSKEQPSELFLASRIRFYIKPRKRIWDQSGMKHLVQITAPKQIIHEMTDGLNQTEVRSRFNALATMVDSRGWAVKHAAAGVGLGSAGTTTLPASDRLVTPDISIPTEKQAVLQSTPDIMDENDSTIARQFDSMIEKSTEAQKSAARDIVAKARQEQTAPQPNEATPDTHSQQDFWFKENKTGGQQGTSVPLPPIVTQPTVQKPVDDNSPSTTASAPLLSEAELLEKAHDKQRRNALQTGVKHGTTINPDGSILQAGVPLTNDDSVTATDDPVAGPPIADQTAVAATNHSQAAEPPQQLTTDPTSQITTNSAPKTDPYTAPSSTQLPQYQPPQEPVTKKRNPDILELAQSNDLNIETLARQAHKNDDGEVVISLH